MRSRNSRNNPANNERLLNNLGYLYLQKGQTDESRLYLDKSIDEYHSKGAAKVLKMVNEYDQRQKAIHEKLSAENVTRSREIPALISQLDVDDATIRLPAVNTLAFDSRYASTTVVAAILERLQDRTNKPLSTQGEINCLTILSRRSRDPWTDQQLSSARNIVAEIEKQSLSQAEHYSVTELKKLYKVSMQPCPKRQTEALDPLIKSMAPYFKIAFLIISRASEM